MLVPDVGILSRQSEMAFRYGGEAVFQLQRAQRQDAAPTTRDYMMEDERCSASQGVDSWQFLRPVRWTIGIWQAAVLPK